jgi:hypothetical protein
MTVSIKPAQAPGIMYKENAQDIIFVKPVRADRSVKAKRAVPKTMLLSEASLAKDWDTPEEDAAWATLRRQHQQPKQ